MDPNISRLGTNGHLRYKTMKKHCKDCTRQRPHTSVLIQKWRTESKATSVNIKKRREREGERAGRREEERTGGMHEIWETAESSVDK